MATDNSLATVVQQYQRTYDRAIEILNIFEDADAAELLRMHAILDAEVERLLTISGLEWADCGNLHRHLSFMAMFLKKGDKLACQQDARDILFFDLPAALRNLVSNSAEDAHFDQRLKDSIGPLMAGGHYDSAIRKAFVILTDRLRRAFGVTEQIDGDELINLVFGKGGKVVVALDDPQKQAMRNLISGFYGVYRNEIAHNDVAIDRERARAIIEMANTIIYDIEKVSASSASKA